MSRILKPLFVACLLLTLFCGAGAANAASLKCGSWRVVPSPNQGTYGDLLYSVTAITTSNVWAVGDYNLANGNGPETLVEHWDGNQWTIVSSPNPPSSGNDFFDVATISANDIWAVGLTTNSTSEHTLTEHWDGTQWSIVPSPGTVELVAVAAVSSNDVWAVGNTSILHWNGSKWSIVQANVPGGLSGLSVVSANDIWAVGASNDATLIEHWDGTQWSVVPSPSPAGIYTGLLKVTAIATNDVWAVGSYQVVDTLGEDIALPLTEHWNGSSWRIVPAPRGKFDYSMLFGVTATSTNNVWAVGYQKIIEHWNGTSWSVVPGARDTLNDVMAIAGTSQVWAVGRTQDLRTLIEYYC
ncbi:MAG: hypothetical protein ABI406_05360 [Ktedonobacteraceae bacterium]